MRHGETGLMPQQSGRRAGERLMRLFQAAGDWSCPTRITVDRRTRKVKHEGCRQAGKWKGGTVGQAAVRMNSPQQGEGFQGQGSNQ